MAISGTPVVYVLDRRKFAFNTGITKYVFAKAALAVCFLVGSSAAEADGCVFGDQKIGGPIDYGFCADGYTDSITVLSAGSIEVEANYALEIKQGSSGVLIDNAGAIKSVRAEAIRAWTDGASIEYSIINRESGSIVGEWGYGIENNSKSTLTSLVNEGDIVSRAEPSYPPRGGIGVPNWGGAIIGQLENKDSGLIEGDVYGIYNYNLGTITTFINAGTIKATGSDGAAIYNAGTITNGITNTGTLDGKVSLGKATLNLNGESARITGAVTGFGNSKVYVNGTFTSENTFNVGHFEITSGGTFKMAHDVTTTSQATFKNDGVLSIVATDASDEVSITNGPYTQDASGVLRINVTDDDTYGKLLVAGIADLPSNAKIDVNVADPDFDFTVSRLENVLFASTLNSDGTFDVTDNSVLFDFSAEKVSGNAIDLLLTSALDQSCVSPVSDSQAGPCGIGSGYTLDSIEVTSGSIQGGEVGVGMYDTATTVTNAGTISGTNQGVAIAEGATVGGVVNSGTITGDKAIQVGAGATITNGITNTGILDGMVVLGGATLNLNGGSSRVTGAVTGGDGSKVNVNGKFSTESTISVDEMTVKSNAEFTVNHAVTTTDSFGLSIAGTDITIINNSVIEGKRGIDALTSRSYSLINNASARLSGDAGAIRNFNATVSEITNRGEISSTSASYAILNTSSSITSFTNEGEVSTARGAAVSNTSDSQIQTLENLSAGSIVGVDQGIFNNGSLIETLENAGTISASATEDPEGEGYSVAGIANLGVITTLNNQDGGLIDSVLRGVYNAATGTITTFTNAGTIRATGSDGYAIDNRGTITNGITNTGTLDGKVELGGATLNINGTSSRVTGAVTGGDDSLVNVNGTFTTENTFDVGTMTVASGGLLTASHNITAGTFTNQGALAVGTGTRTLTGNYTQSSGGVFRTTVASDTEYGKLAVSGTATLAGKAEVTVAGAATALTQGGVLEGVITAEKVEGEFAEVTTTSSIYTFSGVYHPTSFDLLVVAPEPEVIEGNVQRYGSPAALGAAKTLDGLASDPGSMAPVIDTLDGLSEQAQSDAVEQTLPVLVAGGSMAGSQSQTAFNRVLQSRQAVVAGMSSGEEFAGTRDVWGKAFGSWANQGDLNNVSGYSVDSGGLAFGLDRQLSPKANLGLALAYAYSSVKSNSTVAPSSVTVNSYQLGIYGDYTIRPTWQLNYQLDGAINTNSSSRDLSRFAGTPGVGASAKGSYNSYVGHVGLGLKKFLNMGSNTRFTPELRLDYMTVQSDGYTESGGGLLDLRVSSQSYNTLYTGLDLRVDHELKNGINLMANLGAAYNALDNSVQMTSAYQGGGAAFVTDGLKVSPWIYNAGVGVSGMVSKNVELNLRYGIDFSSTSYTNQMVSARVKVLF